MSMPMACSSMPFVNGRPSPSDCEFNYMLIITYKHLLSCDFSFNKTLINDMTRAVIAINAKMLTIVNARSRADRRLHQLGFLQIEEITNNQF